MEQIQDSELNSAEYIQATLDKREYPKEKLSKLFLSIKISAKTLLFGRKWLVYGLITLLPIIFSVFGPDKLFGWESSSEAYIDNLMTILVTLLFSFGALLISLPFTADEISDNIMEGYIVRPVDREILYTARWIVGIVGIWIINSLISTIYYVYFHAFSPGSAFEFFIEDFYLLFNSYGLLLVASIMYGSLFVFIGVIGNKGFTFGIIVAMIETFFISLLFLANSPYIPSTHIKYIADNLFNPVYGYTLMPDNLTAQGSVIFVCVFTIITYFIGIIYFRNREFNE